MMGDEVGEVEEGLLVLALAGAALGVVTACLGVCEGALEEIKVVFSGVEGALGLCTVSDVVVSLCGLMVGAEVVPED